MEQDFPSLLQPTVGPEALFLGGGVLSGPPGTAQEGKWDLHWEEVNGYILFCNVIQSQEMPGLIYATVQGQL